MDMTATMVAIFIRGKKNGLARYSLEVLFNIKGELMCYDEIFFVVDGI